MASGYDILGTHPNASREELQAAYDAKMAEYAPERVAALPEDFQRFAEQRRAEFQAAFQEIRAVRVSPTKLTPEAEQRRDRETIIAVCVLLALALTVPLARPFAVPARTVAVTGAEAAVLTADVAPDFVAQTLDGQPVRLSDFRGKVVLLNFWATWCPPCVRETPRLVQIAEQFKDQGLVVLAVNTTFQDDVGKVRQFVGDQGIGYHVLLDPEGVVGEKYPARLMPTTYLIDRDGKIVHTKVGEADAATLLEQVGSVLQ